MLYAIYMNGFGDYILTYNAHRKYRDTLLLSVTTRKVLSK